MVTAYRVGGIQWVFCGGWHNEKTDKNGRNTET